MSELLLSEEVFLLGHDDESGKNRVAMGLDGALAGALMLDLALGELIEVGERKKVTTTGSLPEHPLLRRAVETIAAEGKERSVSSWLTYLPSRMKPFTETVGRSLVERGVLGEERAKVLGLFSTTRWPEADPEPERRLRERLSGVLVRGAEPARDDVVLIALLKTYDLVNAVVEKPDRGAARKAAEELRKQAERGDVVSKAVGDAVRATQTAILAATVASTAATTAAVTTSNP